MGYLTPDALPTDYKHLCLTVPDVPGFRRAVAGALYALTLSYMWESAGALTPDECAAEMTLLYDSRRWCQPMRPGDMILFAGTDTPDDRLDCNGAQYEKALYPELFEAIGYTWGGSGDYFNVPDMRGRVPVGAGQGVDLTDRALADVGGAEQHTLSVPEMPNHMHDIYWDNKNVSPGAGLTLKRPGGDFNISTWDTGGNQPHNNMQPFAVLRYLIVSR